MMFNDTFINILVISWGSFFMGECGVSREFGEGKRSTLRTQPTCHKSLTNFII